MPGSQYLSSTGEDWKAVNESHPPNDNTDQLQRGQRVVLDERKALSPELSKDSELAAYLPDNWWKKSKLDREWFFNVVSSLYPGYLEQLIAHSQKQRQRATEEEEKTETIAVDGVWRERLSQSTFISRKKGR